MTHEKIELPNCPFHGKSAASTLHRSWSIEIQETKIPNLAHSIPTYPPITCNTFQIFTDQSISSFTILRPYPRVLVSQLGKMPARGGGRNKSGGGARPPPSREETISKAMAYVLRHGAEKEKLKLDESGYINCQELVSMKIQYISFFESFDVENQKKFPSWSYVRCRFRFFTEPFVIGARPRLCNIL